MPIYEYQCVDATGCSKCAPGFDQLQSLNDPPLSACPECGAGVRRILSAPNVGRGDSDLSPKNLEEKGFTQYRRVGKGQYEKTAGKGPRKLSDPGD